MIGCMMTPFTALRGELPGRWTLLRGQDRLPTCRCHGAALAAGLTSPTASATPDSRSVPDYVLHGAREGQPVMKCPDTIQLSREDGEALRARLAGDALTADDRRVLDHVLQWYFWLLFALQEATVSLKRLRVMLFGEKPKKRQEPPMDPAAAPRDSDGGARGADGAPAQGTRAAASQGRPGHGRRGAQAYRGAQPVECRHETLAAGERCPVCGRGRLYH